MQARRVYTRYIAELHDADTELMACVGGMHSRVGGQVIEGCSFLHAAANWVWCWPGLDREVSFRRGSSRQ